MTEPTKGPRRRPPMREPRVTFSVAVPASDFEGLERLAKIYDQPCVQDIVRAVIRQVITRADHEPR